MISTRIQPNLKPNPMFAFMGRALANAYHEVDNPEGVVSLGIAENTLMASEMSEFLSKNMKITSNLFGYGASSPGLPSLIDGLLQLYNKEPFNPVVPVTKKHLYVSSGCTTLLDQISWTLCDEGDGVLIGKPCYGGFAPDMTGRSKLTPIFVSLKGLDPFSLDAVGKYEEQLLIAQTNGVRVRLLVLANPHNPLGQCYPRETLIEFMRLCQKYDVHLLSDEIYALTTFPTKDNPRPTPFTSLMSVDKTGIVDPSLCHVIHGMSKDLCANGLRISALISQANPLLHQAIRTIEMFSWPSSFSGLAISTILNHHTFLTSFLKKNRQLLTERYTHATKFLKAHSINYVPSNAGFFIWTDLSPYLDNYPGETPLERERAMNQALFNGGIHLATSEAFEGEESGWFRLSFAVDQQLLELGLERIARVLCLRPAAIELEPLKISKPRLSATDVFQRLLNDFSTSAPRTVLRVVENRKPKKRSMIVARTTEKSKPRSFEEMLIERFAALSS